MTVELNNAGAGWSVPLGAVRSYRPYLELPDMAPLTVLVVACASIRDASARDSVQDDIKVYVGVMKRLVNTEVGPLLAEADGLMDLVEEIEDHFIDKPLPGFPEAVCIAVERDPIYSPESFQRLRQFTSIPELTFRMIA